MSSLNYQVKYPAGFIAHFVQHSMVCIGPQCKTINLLLSAVFEARLHNKSYTKGAS